jgi:hypothetical protein
MKSARIFLLRYQIYHRSMKSARIFLLRYQKIIIFLWRVFVLSSYEEPHIFLLRYQNYHCLNAVADSATKVA